MPTAKPTPTPTLRPVLEPLPEAQDLFLLDEYEIGMTVKLGAYEQDGNVANGKESLVWQIIDITDGKALLLSVNAIELVRYGTDNARGVTWPNSNLYRWLNNDFYNEAFASYEKLNLVAMPESAVNGSEDANDYTDALVSILSELQIRKYMPDDSQRSCLPSAYAASKGGRTQNGASMWYTWMPNEVSPHGRFVTSTGQIYLASEMQTSILVRPCIWINLN